MSTSAPSEVDQNRRYRIQTVARMTGLATPLLRAWERRYALVTPQRGASGYREYSDEDVQVLQRARRLMERGYTIGEVARLGRAALLAAPSEEALLPARTRGADASLQQLVEQFVRAALRGDVPVAEQIVARALHAPDLNTALTDFVHPALVAIGDAWERRELSPGVEHLATHLLRSPLVDMLCSANAGLGPVYAVTATPPGDLHEIGALMVALQLARSGRRSVHLGPSLPFAEVRHVAELTRAKLVCVSFVQRGDATHIDRQLASLKAEVGQRLPVAVGGRALEGRGPELRAQGFHVTEDPRELADLGLK